MSDFAVATMTWPRSADGCCNFAFASTPGTGITVPSSTMTEPRSVSRKTTRSPAVVIGNSPPTFFTTFGLDTTGTVDDGETADVGEDCVPVVGPSAFLKMSLNVHSSPVFGANTWAMPSLPTTSFVASFNATKSVFSSIFTTDTLSPDVYQRLPVAGSSRPPRSPPMETWASVGSRVPFGSPTTALRATS